MSGLKIISFLIITSVFLGNIGSTIFVHHCEKEGDSFSIFTKIDHSCSTQIQKTCCSFEKKDNSCCSDEVKHVKNDVKVFKVNKNFKLWKSSFNYSSDVEFSFSKFIVSELVTITFYDPPPLFYDLHINILNQVFRI